jgi:hypothetical protein
MTQLQKSTCLYEKDILLWSEETVAKLRARDFDNLDLENLIKEVEALGTQLGRLRTEENKILDFQGLWTSEIFSPSPITQRNALGRGTPCGCPAIMSNLADPVAPSLIG